MSGGRAAPVLLTERLLLAIPPPERAPAVLRYVTENRAHFAPYSPPLSPEHFTETYWRARLGVAREENALGLAVRLHILRRDDPEAPILGDCTLSNILRGPLQAATLGYKLDHRAVGQGFMHEALTALIEHAFGELSLHRLRAGYVPTNERSGRVLRKLGFVVEGYARDYLFIDGAWRDHILTALTNPRPVTPPPPPAAPPSPHGAR